MSFDVTPSGTLRQCFSFHWKKDNRIPCCVWWNYWTDWAIVHYWMWKTNCHCLFPIILRIIPKISMNEIPVDVKLKAVYREQMFVVTEHDSSLVCSCVMNHHKQMSQIPNYCLGLQLHSCTIFSSYLHQWCNTSLYCYCCIISVCHSRQAWKASVLMTVHPGRSGVASWLWSLTRFKAFSLFFCIK